MRTLDFAPFYRSAVGFDRLFDMIDQASRVEASAAWPPYNIEKVGDHAYRVTVAVAGFAADEIELIQNGNALLVSGEKKDGDSERQYLHRGIAARQFRQTFNLADHVKVTGANLDNGLLTIDLAREVPEALKPRHIAIGGKQATASQDHAPAQIEHEDKVA